MKLWHGVKLIATVPERVKLVIGEYVMLFGERDGTA